MIVLPADLGLSHGGGKDSLFYFDTEEKREKSTSNCPVSSERWCNEKF
jgi:hypothetical protein